MYLLGASIPIAHLCFWILSCLIQRFALGGSLPVSTNPIRKNYVFFSRKGITMLSCLGMDPGLVCANSFRQVSFFNRSFSISSFATISRSRSASERVLLVWSAANGLPGWSLCSNEISPSARYFFTQGRSCSCPPDILFPVFLLRYVHPDACVWFLNSVLESMSAAFVPFSK